jgi:hypothetical protein
MDLAQPNDVLALHRIERRYLPDDRHPVSFPTAGTALREHMRIVMSGGRVSAQRVSPDEMPFFEVCKECSRIENDRDSEVQRSEGVGVLYGKNPKRGNDDLFGTRISTAYSAWPCATIRAITADRGEGASRDEFNLRLVIERVLEQWESGGNLTDDGSWTPPLWPQPIGADMLRKALEGHKG